MVPFEGQFRIGEFRGDVAEFQELVVASCQNHPNCWQFLA